LPGGGFLAGRLAGLLAGFRVSSLAGSSPPRPLLCHPVEPVDGDVAREAPTGVVRVSTPEGEQQPYEVNVAGRDGGDQWGLTQAVRDVRARAVRQKDLHALRVVLARGEAQRRVAEHGRGEVGVRARSQQLLHHGVLVD
jgi:hypothetical protein